MLATHFLDPAALRADDFDRFFEHRRHALLDLIAEAIGKRAIDDTEESSELAEAAMFEPEPEDLSDEEVMLEEA